METTAYSGFAVSGTSPARIYQALVTHSQPKGLYATLATTEVVMQPDIALRPGPPCRVRHANLKLTFKVHLPVLAPSQDLTSETRRDWLVFAAHLRQHEAHHRAFWRTCAQRYASALRHLVKPDCASFVSAAKRQWSGIEQVCLGRNARYDAQEQERLLRFRFIERALRE
jgi:predicted secreted Zn-dependent protease